MYVMYVSDQMWCKIIKLSSSFPMTRVSQIFGIIDLDLLNRKQTAQQKTLENICQTTTTTKAYIHVYTIMQLQYKIWTNDSHLEPRLLLQKQSDRETGFWCFLIVLVQCTYLQELDSLGCRPKTACSRWLAGKKAVLFCCIRPGSLIIGTIGFVKASMTYSAIRQTIPGTGYCKSWNQSHVGFKLVSSISNWFRQFDLLLNYHASSCFESQLWSSPLYTFAICHSGETHPRPSWNRREHVQDSRIIFEFCTHSFSSLWLMFFISSTGSHNNTEIDWNINLKYFEVKCSIWTPMS